MKRIRTQSTLVSAKHGLVVDKKYTTTFNLQHNSTYTYELYIQAPWASGCAVTCQMASNGPMPAILQFQNANPAPTSINIVGGSGSYYNEVIPSTPQHVGYRNQKIALDVTVSHQIGQVNFQDALSIQVEG